MVENDGFVNYAEDEKIREQFRAKFFPSYRACKDNRQVMDLNMIRWHKIWSMQRADFQGYFGRADLKHAPPRRAVETVARKLHQTILPDNDYFSILAKPGLGGATDRGAEATESLMKHFFEGPSKLKVKAIPFFRQLTMLGTGIIKSDWEKKIIKKRFRGKLKDVTVKNNPLIRPVDIFRFYVFPWNIWFLDDAMMTFEEFTENESYIKYMTDEGFFIKDHDLTPFTKYRYDQHTRLMTEGHNDPSLYTNHNQKLYNLVESYGTLEIEGEERAIMGITDEYGKVAMISDNPFDHCEHPYSLGQYVMNQVPFIWGQGIIEIIESLSCELNDIANQMMDNKTMALNPIAVIDPMKARDHASFKFSPMAKWLIEPDAVKFMVPPDLSAAGLQAFQLVKNEILEASDAVPNMPPQMRGVGRTVSRDRAVSVEMASELSEFIRQTTLTFEDLIRKTHSNIQQNITEEQYVRILKKDSKSFHVMKITPDDIIGDYDFQWLGSNRTSLDRMQTQQLINMLRIALAGQAKFDVNYLIRKILREGFNFSDADQIMGSEDAQTSIDQDIENILLKLGRYVPISPADDDQKHLQDLQEEFGDQNSWTDLGDQIGECVKDHANRHIGGMQAKQQVAQRASQQAMQEAMQAKMQQKQLGGPQQQGPSIQGKTGQEAMPSGVDQSGDMAMGGMMGGSQ